MAKKPPRQKSGKLSKKARVIVPHPFVWDLLAMIPGKQKTLQRELGVYIGSDSTQMSKFINGKKGGPDYSASKYLRKFVEFFHSRGLYSVTEPMVLAYLKDDELHPIAREDLKERRRHPVGDFATFATGTALFGGKRAPPAQAAKDVMASKEALKNLHEARDALRRLGVHIDFKITPPENDKEK